ncbi:MAG: hypothetical protein RR588_03805 [Solibacillus sp.]
MRIIRPERNTNFHAAVNPMLGVVAGGSSWLVDEIWSEPKELDFLHYEQDVTNRFEALQASQQIDSSSIDYARSQGVEHEWEMVHFFANEDVHASENILQYVNDDGKLVSFTEGELDLIRAWQPGESYPVKGIEGHHIQTIREHNSDIQLASDSDNILLATDFAHRAHLHGGSTFNPTQEAFLNVKLSNEDRLAQMIASNEDKMVPSFLEGASGAMLTSAILGVTIGQVILLYQMKNDSRPWDEKRKVMASAALVSTMIGAGAGAVAYSANVMLNASFAELSVGTVDLFFADMIGLNGSIFAVQLASATFSYVRALQTGENKKQAFNRYKDEMMTAVAELAAFSALGLGLEIGTDMIGDLLIDAIIPDPTGILIALRVTYSLFKMGSKMNDKKKQQEAYNRCIEIRERHQYEVALTSI